MVAIAGALLVGGCGDDGDDDGGTPARAGAAAQGASAALRAQLVRAEADQIFLTGAAIAEAVRSGPDKAEFAAALTTAKTNAAELANAVMGAYGAGPAGELTTLLRKQIDGFGEYAKAELAQSDAAVQEALATLDELRADQARLLARTIGKLGRTDIAEDLRIQIQGLIGAADAIVAKEGDAYAELGEAAGRGPLTAERLAAAIAADKRDRYPEPTDGPAAATRAGLTSLLVADSYLALLHTNAIVRFGGDAETTRKAGRAADENAVAFAQWISSVYGEESSQRLLKQWRAQGRLVANYARAKVREDDIAARTALSQLEMWSGEAATLISQLNPRLRQEQLVDVLRAAIDARTGAVRADVAHSPKTYARLQESATASVAIATLLARGISAQFPSQFDE